MRVITDEEMKMMAGGMNMSGEAESSNVIDLRGRNMGSYIDANGGCWAPGTPSSSMYPNGADGDE
ncbi:hypothetical protein AB4156_07680 [Cupriavidus sp. 2MCAB6]|uniref:hypothetical protein n=1 Tax=Cupriavidus sp. 2MCAB6 TaxID=3232981 RepID=UPI003F90EBF1